MCQLSRRDETSWVIRSRRGNPSARAVAHRPHRQPSGRGSRFRLRLALGWLIIESGTCEHEGEQIRGGGDTARAGRYLDGPKALVALESYFSGTLPRCLVRCCWAAERRGHRSAGGSDTNRLTIEDVLSLALLDVGVGTDTMVALLDLNAEISSWLSRIDRSLCLADAPAPADDSEGPWVAADQVWKMLHSVPGVGRTRTSKLMARKRPHLIPIRDRVVVQALGAGKVDNYWALVQQVVRAHRDRLAELHTDLQVAHPGDGPIRALSDLRVLDVVIWMRAPRRPRSRS